MSLSLRRLQARDLPAVMRLQAQAYPDLCESENAIASRLQQAPSWCWVAEGGDDIAAYLLSHPWRHTAPPAWNAPLPRLPAHGTRFYIHDLALGPAARGNGLARRLIQHVLQEAQRARFHEVQLVAVQGSTGFWQRLGFHVLPLQDEKLRQKLASYGDDARLMGRQL
ncbi:MAG TPA: GNAT family N-acetyltransferase [Moraxellaceae bacterium]